MITVIAILLVVLCYGIAMMTGATLALSTKMSNNWKIAIGCASSGFLCLLINVLAWVNYR